VKGNHGMKNLIRVVALLMTVGPVFARSAVRQTPPQTFVLTKDGACSLTSSNLHEQIAYPGSHMFITRGTPHDIVWSATWDTTGCTLPMFVVVAFDYLNTKQEVVLTRYWWIKVPAGHFVARGDLRQVTDKINWVRMTKLRLETEEHYNAEMLKLAAERAAAQKKP